MFLKMNHLLFFNTLIIGTLMAISSNSWFTAWVGLEVNLMSMIPLILIKINQSFSESSIKYFITQAMASIMLILSVTINILTTEEQTVIIEQWLIFLALLLKSGIPPFHFWFPQIILLMNWFQCFIIFTWQKLAPLILLSQLNNKITVIAAVAAMVVGSISGINQLKTKIIMTYSSIAHSGWIISAAIISLTIWWIYFLIYVFLTSIIIFTMNFFSINKLNDINFKMNWLMKYLFSLNLLTLGGLPPFLGFLSKITILMPLIYSNLIIQPMVMIMTSLMSLYFYYRAIYTSVMQKETFKKIFSLSTTKNNMMIIVSTFMSIILPAMTFIN